MEPLVSTWLLRNNPFLFLTGHIHYAIAVYYRGSILVQNRINGIGGNDKLFIRKVLKYTSVFLYLSGATPYSL